MPAELQNPGYRWDDLRVLLALCRSGTLSGAAATLGVNASTVGRRMDALEEGLGVRLFDRTPDGAHPTAAAERLVPIAEELELSAHQVAAAIAGFEAEPEGEVRLTGPPGVMDVFVAPAVHRLREKYPGVRLLLDSSVGYADLTRREADIALRAMRPETGDLVSVQVARSPVVPMATPHYAEELGLLRDPGKARWVGWGDGLGHLPDAQWIRSHVPPDCIVARSDTHSTLLAIVMTGMAAGLFPAAYARTLPLVPIRLAKAVRERLRGRPEGTLWLVGHRALRNVPRIAAVWDFLKDEVLLPE